MIKDNFAHAHAARFLLKINERQVVHHWGVHCKLVYQFLLNVPQTPNIGKLEGGLNSIYSNERLFNDLIQISHWVIKYAELKSG